MMRKEIDRLLALTTELLPKGLSMDTFEDRFTLQKMVYLVQSFGLNAGYKFNWYVHGPYSPDLTRVAYAALENEADKSEHGVRLTDQAKANTERCRAFVENNLPGGVDRLVWLEALASVHFLTEVVGLEEQEMVKRMAGEKPNVSGPIVRDALHALQKVELQVQK